MKKSDILFFLFVIALFLPFFISDTIYEWYKSFNAIHGMVMSFVKFAILATLGEMLGLRISTGVYHNKTFGIIPRMVIWGVLGMGINMAMIIFSKGTPIFLEYMGLEYASTLMNGDFCLAKFLVALAISVTMNSIFAPVFMTLHKITDTHIGNCGGSIKALSTPYSHDTYFHRIELGGTLELCIQKDHPFILVSGPHHHFPASSGHAGIICRHSRGGTGSITSYRC